MRLFTSKAQLHSGSFWVNSSFRTLVFCHILDLLKKELGQRPDIELVVHPVYSSGLILLPFFRAVG